VVKLWVANTDLEWFDYLAGQADVDEVNFWQPSGDKTFGAIHPGELFLFKLKSPRNVIGGYGVLSQSSNLPLSLAWEAFGTKNGARSLLEMRQRIGRYRRDGATAKDYTIGCRIVVQPVFFPEALWIEQPKSWARSIVVGKVFDTDNPEGLRLWTQLMEATEAVRALQVGRDQAVADQRIGYVALGPRYGEPQIVRPRLGQGAFRIAVTDAYKRQCAISGGRVLPALDAAHIRSYSEGGLHEVSNGLLLRRDIHCVFDAGYATIDEGMRWVVSDRVRTDFNNGNEYRRLHGHKLSIPDLIAAQPDAEQLRWHRDNKFLG
jgi:putative restriction endonuclease